MKLTEQSLLAEQAAWTEKGYHVPAYDRAAMREKTAQAPVWVHFGAGNIFRAFQANVWQKALEAGKTDTGIIVCGGGNKEVVRKVYRPHDCLFVLATLCADGQVQKSVIGSVAQALNVGPEETEDWETLKHIFGEDSLQMVSFTITEKGYRTADADGTVLPKVAADFAAGPEKPESYIGCIASLLYARFLSGRKKIAMVSMDNCSHNGDKLREAMLAFARSWEAGGTVKPGFADYLSDPSLVSFPWSMIDKITPGPDETVRQMLARDGVEGLESAVGGHANSSPFVNAEETEYLVIEDAFPNGRPPLEAGGVIFTDRETVDRVEKMKVCTCLNPLHTSLAVYGCLLGYTKMSEEMKDPQLRGLAEGVGYREGLPVVTDPGIMDPKEFLDTVLTKRIPNPFLPDTPQRIATDTSQKIPIRFGETVRAYMTRPDLDPQDLTLIPLVYAGWLRYLMGITDEGTPFTPSPDPQLDYASGFVSSFRPGTVPETGEILTAVRPLLENETIFGVNLTAAGLSEKVCGMFAELLEGPGAVRKTLKKYVTE